MQIVMQSIVKSKQFGKQYHLYIGGICEGRVVSVISTKCGELNQ